MKELRGKEVSNAIKNEIEEILKNIKKIPRLGIIRIGENEADISYEKGATKKLKAFGLEVSNFIFDKNISNEEFKNELIKINMDRSIDGILILRPLPSHINEDEIEKLIDEKKDLDCINPINIANIFLGKKDIFAPCTAQAVIEMLKYYNIDIASKNVVILGRSMVVGKPLAMLFLNENATVTICHSKTKNLNDICKNADILVSCIGKAKFINATYIKDNAVVIDVGINIGEDGKLCGDVDFEDASKKANMISLVPGGLGVVTTAILAKHLVYSLLK